MSGALVRVGVRRRDDARRPGGRWVARVGAVVGAGALRRAGRGAARGGQRPRPLPVAPDPAGTAPGDHRQRVAPAVRRSRRRVGPARREPGGPRRAAPPLGRVALWQDGASLAGVAEQTMRLSA
ncbi:hypothetical protein ACFSTC_22260 [Nonomuraea ferruginea]